MSVDLDPIISLALAIHSAHGVYIPIIGSGVSRAAEIPTGWEVVVDLITRVAAAEGDDPGPDPAAWYRSNFGKDPSYSVLLENLAPAPGDRNLLLRSYFEATADDIAAGRKVPTAAHRDIARLAAGGYLRALVTTNFDRLAENALHAAGVTPQVITTPDAIRGALPLQHAPFTVIKVNGDYLDLRFRNTVDELSAYSPAMTRYLRRLFEDHGLIVCGWSAEWDIELRRAMEGAANRRFAAYWCARGPLSGAAANLVALRGFTTIAIREANSFFTSLADKVESLDRLNAPHPLSAPLAAAATKKLLTDDANEIRLADLVLGEAGKLATQMRAERDQREADRTVDPADVLPRFLGYESSLHIMSAICSVGGHWGRSWAEPLWTRTIDLLVANSFDETFLSRSINMLRFPVMFLLYVSGISAIANGRFGNFGAFVTRPRRRRERRETGLVTALDGYDLFNGEEDLMYSLRGKNEYTPVSNHLFERVKPHLAELHLTDARYERCFVEFEYLAAMIGVDELDGDGRGGWDGRFLWNRSVGDEVIADVRKRVEQEKDNWAPLRAGMFGGLLDRAVKSRDALNEWIVSWRQHHVR